MIIVRCGAVWCDMIIVRCVAVRCGADALLRGAARYGLFFSGIVRCGAVRLFVE